MASGQDGGFGGERTLAVVRHELEALSRRSRRRTVGWPNDWRPSSVCDPRDSDRQPFTEVGAWLFIADLLAEGHPIEEIRLKDPPDKPGYVLIVESGTTDPIYIKLEMGSGMVIGRSFHYSYPPPED